MSCTPREARWLFYPSRFLSPYPIQPWEVGPRPTHVESPNHGEQSVVASLIPTGKLRQNLAAYCLGLVWFPSIWEPTSPLSRTSAGFPLSRWRATVSDPGLPSSSLQTPPQWSGAISLALPNSSSPRPTLPDQNAMWCFSLFHSSPLPRARMKQREARKVESPDCALKMRTQI